MKFKNKTGLIASILSISIWSFLVPLSSCSKTNSIDQIIANNHDWNDVSNQKQQMINSTINSSKINYESSPLLQSEYASENEYVNEQAQIYQSNLELEVQRYKSQRTRTSNEVYSLLSEKAQSSRMNTIDWRTLDKNFSTIENSLYTKINSIDGLTRNQKNELYDQVTNQVNLAIYKSKNSNLDFQGTKNLIKNEIDQIIEHLQRSTEKLLAFNSLNDLLASFDFSINKKVLDSNLKDKSISIHELTKDHTEDELNEIKESLLPLMFTYRNLPVKSDIIENYYFGFDTTEIAWTNPVTAQVSFEFYLTKKDNTNEKLATFSFEKISIEDNLSGKRDALTKYIDDLDIVFQKKLPEYESFKDKIVSSISPDSQGRYFVNQELLLQICKKFKLNSLSDNQDFFDNLRSDNIFSIGAHVKFLDESILSENQRKIQFNILFYDSQVTSDSSINSDSSSYIICESEKTYEITLAVESDLILKNAYIQELTLGTFDENLQSLLKIHNFLDNPETKNTIDEASDKAKLLVDCNTAYLVIDYFSQVSSVLIDVVCVSPVFFFLDLGVGAYDLFSAHNAEERYKSLKKSYNEQKDVYDEVVKSDGYLQLDQLFKSNDVNLYQIQKDVHNKMDEFGMLVSSKDSIYDFSIKDPETLLNELKDKYKVYSLEESLEELENNEFKWSTYLVEILKNSWPEMFEIAKNMTEIFSHNKAVDFNTKIARLDSMVNRFDLMTTQLIQGPKVRGAINPELAQEFHYEPISYIWEEYGFDPNQRPSLITLDEFNSNFSVENIGASLRKYFTDSSLTTEQIQYIAKSVSDAYIGFNQFIDDAEPAELIKMFMDNMYGKLFNQSQFKIESMACSYLMKGKNCFNDPLFIENFKNTFKENLKSNMKYYFNDNIRRAFINSGISDDAELIKATNMILNDQQFDLVVDDLSSFAMKSIDEIGDILSGMSDVDKELMQLQLACATPYAVFDAPIIGIRYQSQSTGFTKQIMDDASTQYIREHFYPDGYDYSKDFLENATCSETFEKLVGENNLEKTTKIYMERNAAKAIDVQSAARTKIATFKAKFKTSIKNTVAKIVTLRQNKFAAIEKVANKQDLKSIKNIINNKNLTHEQKLTQLKPFGQNCVEAFNAQYEPGNCRYIADFHPSTVSYEFALNKFLLNNFAKVIAGAMLLGIVAMVLQNFIQYFDDMYDL